MCKRISFIMVVVLYGCILSVNAKSVVLPFELTYNAKVAGFSIETTRSFKKIDDQWEMALIAHSSVAELSEKTRVIIDNQTVKPQKYDYSHRILLSKKVKQAQFDWKKNQVKWQSQDTLVELKENVQDALSYQLQLQIDLALGKKIFDYTLLGKDKLKTRQFIIDGKEELSTPLGKLKTVKLKIKRENSDRQVFLWMAEDLNFTLVKLIQKGKVDFIFELSGGVINGSSVKSILSSI